MNKMFQCAFLMILALTLAAFVGCSKSSTTVNNQSDTSSAQAAAAPAEVAPAEAAPAEAAPAA
ncbi:MAG: hypothetical protein IIZ25_07275, partial [Thermoguttaceae bacterium]|nr:hypothetical protein [Thermoguttaceae bacterium]